MGGKKDGWIGRRMVKWVDGLKEGWMDWKKDV